MGQTWYIANIDKFEGYNIGKGENFFSKAPFPACDFLMVPAVPIETGGFQIPGKRLAGSWAGSRIICIGDYASDWPKSLQGLSTLVELPVNERFRGYCSDVFERNISYGYNSEEAYPEDHIWVLRNLSKKEYVRSDRIPIKVDDSSRLEYRQDADVSDCPGLAFVLISRICWSPAAPICLAYDKTEELVQGIWAGDKFDISFFELVKGEMFDEGWKDVSRREAEHMHDLLSQHTGTKWPLPDEPKGAEV